MTAEDLKDFLFHSMRLRGDYAPNHHINLSFQCEELSMDELNAFVYAVQSKLTENELGELLIYGIDEDQKNGEFLIYCNNTNSIRETYELILPIIEANTFFQNAWCDLLLPTDNGGFIVEGDTIRETIPISDDSEEIEPPVPEGFEEEKRGCIPPLAVLGVLFAMIIVLFW